MLVGIIAASVFFISVRGAERTMVPDVEGRELTAALLELQVKELYPRILLRFTQSSADRGFILEQTPRPGTIVRAGRRIQLVVSQGAMINTIENYIGRNIYEVRMDIQAMSASHTWSGGAPAQQLITIREPLMLEYSAEPAGTILQQRPEPGTPISGPAVLELVVSRGPQDALVTLPNLAGLRFDAALEQIGRTGIDFEFSLRPLRVGETPETVVSQDPPGNTLAASGTRVNLVVAAPERLPGDDVFGLFVFEMARNPFPLLTQLEAVIPGGQRQQLLSVQFAGGRLAVPYRLPAGTMLVLSMLNREIHRETVSPPVAAMPMDWF